MDHFSIFAIINEKLINKDPRISVRLRGDWEKFSINNNDTCAVIIVYKMLFQMPYCALNHKQWVASFCRIAMTHIDSWIFIY